ncbi:hypothetical protein ACLKA7_004037 [Drosophila subpalustris]
MKIIFVGLFVTFLAVQDCQAEVPELSPGILLLGGGFLYGFNSYGYGENHEIPADEVAVQLISQSKEDSAEDSKKSLAERIEMLNEKINEFEYKFLIYDAVSGKLEKKFEELRETVTAIKDRQVPKFEKIGSKYYYIDDTDEVNWFDAAHKCRSMGGNLADLQSAEELRAVSEKLTRLQYWLDINDLAEEGVFQLLSSGRRADFLQWHAHEPNNKNVENCVVLVKYGSTYAMNDNHCETKLNFICEKDKLE